MTLLVTVETDEMAQVLASRLMTVFFFSLPNFLVGGPAILGPRGV